MVVAFWSGDILHPCYWCQQLHEGAENQTQDNHLQKIEEQAEGMFPSTPGISGLTLYMAKSIPFALPHLLREKPCALCCAIIHWLRRCCPILTGGLFSSPAITSLWVLNQWEGIPQQNYSDISEIKACTLCLRYAKGEKLWLCLAFCSNSPFSFHANKQINSKCPIPTWRCCNVVFEALKV